MALLEKLKLRLIFFLTSKSSARSAQHTSANCTALFFLVVKCKQGVAMFKAIIKSVNIIF